jgi:hypothetical protein
MASSSDLEEGARENPVTTKFIEFVVNESPTEAVISSTSE